MNPSIYNIKATTVLITFKTSQLASRQGKSYEQRWPQRVSKSTILYNPYHVFIYSYVAGQATLNVVNNNYFEVNLYRKLKAIQLCMLQNQGTIGLFIKIL